MTDYQIGLLIIVGVMVVYECVQCLKEVVRIREGESTFQSFMGYFLLFGILSVMFLFLIYSFSK
jgi:uncharacterized membrane protein YjfL (UPF0719 family)